MFQPRRKSNLITRLIRGDASNAAGPPIWLLHASPNKTKPKRRRRGRSNATQRRYRATRDRAPSASRRDRQNSVRNDVSGSLRQRRGLREIDWRRSHRRRRRSTAPCFPSAVPGLGGRFRRRAGPRELSRSRRGWKAIRDLANRCAASARTCLPAPEASSTPCPRPASRAGCRDRRSRRRSP